MIPAIRRFLSPARLGQADECECAAAKVGDPQTQASYREMSRRWHAKQVLPLNAAARNRHYFYFPLGANDWSVNGDAVGT